MYSKVINIKKIIYMEIKRFRLSAFELVT